MLNIPVLLATSLIWSGFWMLFIALALRYFPWTLEHDYPQDVREAAAIPRPHQKQKRAATLFGGLGFFFLLLFVVLSVFWTYDLESLSLGTIFWHVFIMFMTWNLVDLLLVDWLLICLLSSKFFILANTENCAGNKDYLFHFKGFLKGCLTMTVLAILVTGLIFLLLKLIN